VTQLLMTEPVYRSPKDHARRVLELVDEIRSGARSAYRAALMLMGQDRGPARSVDGAMQQDAGRNT
jgi:hypothetical protein